MVGSEVHLCEHVEVVFHLRTIGEDKAHAREDIDDLVGDDRQRMTRTELDGVGCARQVEGLFARLLRLTLLTQLVDALGGECLQFIDLHADGLLLVGSNVAEVVHQGCDLTFLAEIFQSELFHFLGVLGA